MATERKCASTRFEANVARLSEKLKVLQIAVVKLFRVTVVAKTQESVRHIFESSLYRLAGHERADAVLCFDVLCSLCVCW